MDEKGNLLEKCLQPSWIQSGYCAEYNALAHKFDAEPCNADLGICPQKTYQSNEVMLYSACLSGARTTIRGVSISTLSALTATNRPTTAKPIDNGNEHLRVLVPLVVVLVVVVIGIIGIIGRVKARKKTGRKFGRSCNRRCWKHSSSNDKHEKETLEDSTTEDEKTASQPFLTTEKDEKPGEEPDQNEHTSAPHREKDRTPGEETDQKLQINDEYYSAPHRVENDSKTEDTFPVKRPPFMDNTSYVKTSLAKKLEKMIHSLSHIIIHGKPGTGKTSLAWNTCKGFHGVILGSQKCVFQLYTNFKEDIIENLSTSKRTLLLLDDWFEDCLYDTSLRSVYASWLGKLSVWCKKSQSASIVITMTSEVYQIFANDCTDMRDAFRVISVSDKAYAEVDLLKILSSKFEGLGTQSNDAIKDIFEQTVSIAKSVEIGYPLLCTLQPIYHRVNAFEIKRTEDPFLEILDELKGRRTSKYERDKDIYCTVMYTVLTGGILRLSDIDENLFKDIGKTIQKENPNIDPDHPLLRQNKAHSDVYEILHERILQLLFVSFSYRCLDLSLTKAQTKLLLKYVRKEKEDAKRFLIIEKEIDRRLLFVRLLKENIDITSLVVW